MRTVRKKVLVTGARGFVGRHLCTELIRRNFDVRAAVRSSRGLKSSPSLEFFEVHDLANFTAWSRLLDGVQAVVHLVARTHATDEFGHAAMRAYRETNVDITRRLAAAAARNGTRRFVFMSSIKAVGNGHDFAYTEATPCNPEDSYGVSKREAEQALARTLRGTDCDYTILRPPLIYGVGVQGNFLRLLRLVDRGVPLPAIKNARSMVHVDNLVDATIRCLCSDGARNQLFHVADPQPISTSDVVRSMASGLGRSPLLLPLPNALLTRFANALGKGGEVKRLFGSLTVSTAKLSSELGWTGKSTTKAGVVKVSRAYAAQPWTAASIGHPVDDGMRRAA